MGEGRTGGCACGAVSYTVSGELRPVVACHCESCRRQSGNYVAATAAAADELSIEGAENLVEWQASPHAVRRFCRICGSHLFWHRPGDKTVSIMAGSVDHLPPGIAVSYHIFVAEKGAYYEICDGAPQYAEWQPEKS